MCKWFENSLMFTDIFAWRLGNCTVGFVALLMLTVALLMLTVDFLEFKYEEVVDLIRDL